MGLESFKRGQKEYIVVSFLPEACFLYQSSTPLHEVLANEWSSVKKEVTSHQALSLPVC